MEHTGHVYGERTEQTDDDIQCLEGTPWFLACGNIHGTNNEGSSVFGNCSTPNEESEPGNWDNGHLEGEEISEAGHMQHGNWSLSYG